MTDTILATAADAASTKELRTNNIVGQLALDQYCDNPGRDGLGAGVIG
jgi:hypothetical protein